MPIDIERPTFYIILNVKCWFFLVGYYEQQPGPIKDCHDSRLLYADLAIENEVCIGWSFNYYIRNCCTYLRGVGYFMKQNLFILLIIESGELKGFKHGEAEVMNRLNSGVIT